MDCPRSGQIVGFGARFGRPMRPVTETATGPRQPTKSPLSWPIRSSRVSRRPRGTRTWYLPRDRAVDRCREDARIPSKERTDDRARMRVAQIVQTIGIELRTARQAAGLSQPDVARAARISQTKLPSHLPGSAVVDPLSPAAHQRGLGLSAAAATYSTSVLYDARPQPVHEGSTRCSTGAGRRLL